jgi:hypothetical protein
MLVVSEEEDGPGYAGWHRKQSGLASILCLLDYEFH